MSPGTAFQTRWRVAVTSARFFPRSEVTSWKTARVSVSGAGGPASVGHERAADEGRLGLPAREVDERRGDVDVPDRRAHAPRRQARDAHDERHLGLRRVEVEAVLGHAVLAEALAVIAGQDDGGVVPEPGGAQVLDEAPEVEIGEPDLAVVEIDARRAEGRHLGVGLVGEVRIVVVQPEEEPSIAVLVDEGDRVVGDLARRRPARLHRPVDRDVERGAIGAVHVHAALEAAVIGEREVAEAEHPAGEHAGVVQRLGGRAHVRDRGAATRSTRPR